MTVSPAWTNPTSGTTDLSNGAIVNEANWDAVVSNLMYKGGTTGFVAARVTHSAAQSVANNSWQALLFDSEHSDPEGFHSTSSNTSRLTVPSGHGGFYAVGINAGFAVNSTGSRGLRALVNGTSPWGLTLIPNAGASDGTTLAIAVAIPLSAGDYVEAQAFQNSGGALNVTTGAFFDPIFWIAKL